MTKRTLIYFHATDPVEVSWVVFENGHIEQSVVRSQLSSMPDNIKKYDTIVYVPASDVLLAQATLPKLNRQRLLQALPFTLEEQLIADVDSLHFAIADTRENDIVCAAIVSRKKMDEWLALLNEFNIIPTCIYSAVFALPYQEKNWHVVIEKNVCTIRQNRYSGFSCETSNLSLLLRLAIEETTDKPNTIQVYDTLSMQSDMRNIKIELNQISLSEQTWLENITTYLDAEPAINLLQGDYRAKRKTSESKKIWLLAGYMTMAWIGLAFFSNLLSFFILHHQTGNLDSAINTIYKKNFPHATSIVAPRERMQSKLASLTDLANNNYFLVLLAKISSTLSTNHSIKIKNMDYRNNQFNLEITAAKFDDLDALTKALQNQGLKAKQQNAATAGTEVKANVIIR